MTHFNLDQTKLEAAAAKLRAISHPARIAILEMLADKELCVTDIYTQLDIDQATTSHHLNVLKNNGVLVSHRKGKMILYSLKHKSLTDILNCINKCQD